MTTYPDEQLDYYADRFVALRLARHGWTLLQYLAAPATGEERALEPEPPLERQRAAVLRLWHQQDTGIGAPVGTPHDHIEPYWPHLLEKWRGEIESEETGVANLPRCNNGAAIEPMRHHRHIRKRNTNAHCKRSKRGA